MVERNDDLTECAFKAIPPTVVSDCGDGSMTYAPAEGIWGLEESFPNP